jgi:hypothetical protein
LTDAFAARSKTGVFLFGFSGCHIRVLSVSEDDVQRTRHSSRPEKGVRRWQMIARKGPSLHPSRGQGMAGMPGRGRYTRPL